MSIADKYRPRFTYDDYLKWEGKWELIVGIPNAMSQTSSIDHQRYNGNFYRRFETALENSCKKCYVYLPIDWKISERTVV